jgi:hypothetical protein
MLNATDRRALRSVGLQFLVNGVVFASFIPRLPEIRTAIDVDLDRLGLLLTLGSLGGIAGSFLVSSVLSRFGTKRTMTVGALGLAATLPVIGFSTNAPMFVAGLLVMQFFDVMTDMAMNMQGSWLSGRRSVPVINRLHGLWSLGSVIGGAGAAAVATSVSLRTHLVVVSLVLLATVAYVIPGLLKVDEHVNDADSARTAGRTFRISPTVVIFAVMGAGAIAIEFVPSDWAALRLTDDFGLAAGVAGLGFVAFTTGMVTGRFSGDTLTARLGPDTMARATMIVAATGIAIATLIPWNVATIVGLFIAGTGVAAVFPRLYDDAAKAPGRPGALLGAMGVGSRLGALATPVAVGALAESPLAVGSAMAVVALPAAVMVFVVREYARRM